MSTLIGGLNEVFRMYAITGNTIIDSIILANIIPIIIAYITTIFEVIKNNIYNICNYLYKYLIYKFKSRFIGEEVCKVEISKNSPIYLSLKNIICSNNNNKNQISGRIVNQLLNILSSSNSSKNFGINNEYNLQYNRENNNFILNQNYSNEEEKIKIFLKKELYFVLKYILKKSQNDNKVTEVTEKIELNIIKFNNNKCGQEEITKVFNEFLNEDLELSSEIIYTVQLKTNNVEVINILTKFIQNNVIEPMQCLLDAGDGRFKGEYTSNAIYDNNNLLLDISLSNLNELTEDIKNNIKLEKDIDFVENANGFMQLYNKYFDPNIKVGGHYGYFFDDNILFMVSTSPAKIMLVSKGKILTNEYLKDKIEFLLRLAIKKSEKVKNNISITSTNIKVPIRLQTYNKNGGWNTLNIEPRTFSSIYLPKKLIDEVKTEMNNFINLNKLYKLCSVPYRKGFLFYGPPGTGKTSLVKAMAYEYQMDIYTINLNDPTINDETINTILNSMGSMSNKILLFEDIDTAFADKEKIKNENKIVYNTIDNDDEENENKKNKNKNSQNINFLTYSGLLNALDGVLTNHYGVITIMTTNYIEKLGSAFIRPGRIDKKFNLNECNREQIIKMTKNFIENYLTILKEKNADENRSVEDFEKKINEFADNLLQGKERTDFTPSKLQVYILGNIENIENIFTNYHYLFEN